MDALFKATILFEARGKVTETGWTETFYSREPAFSIVESDVKDYIKKRKELLGWGAVITGFRVSNVRSNRVTRVGVALGTDGTSSIYTDFTTAYDPTQVDLLCRMETNSGKRRQFWLGGLPRTAVRTDLEEGIPPSFVGGPEFLAWQAQVQSSQFEIRFKDLGNPPSFFTSLPITRIIPESLRNRKRGRPFFQFRGRRLA